jgi:phosphate transport system protein
VARQHMQRDLETMHRDLLRMAGLVEEAVGNAVRALREGDADLARRVSEADAEIDELENRVDDDCFRVLALHQPVAGDLRRTAAVLMITAELERMGDLAKHIAKRAVRLSRMPGLPVPPELGRMAEAAAAMVRQSLDAYVHGDTNLAREVCRRDDEVDRAKKTVKTGVLAAMRSSPDLIDPGLAMLAVSRHLERIADHATSIAGDVIYLVEGRIIRHCREEDWEG